MLVKNKYSLVHEPELVTGNGSQVYSEVNGTLNKVKICYLCKFKGFIMI